MTRREIVRQTLQHKRTNPIPYFINVDPRAMPKMIEDCGDPDFLENNGGFLVEFGYDPKVEIPGKPGVYQDMFGATWDLSDIHHMVSGELIKDLEDYDYEIPPLDEIALRKVCEAAMEQKKHDDRFFLFDLVWTLFDRAWILAGMENVLCGMITCPEKTEELFGKLGDFWGHVVDIVLEYDFDGIFFQEDWGQQHGPIMGLDHWRHYIKPHVEKWYKKVKEKGLYVFQHSCGDCRELFPDMIEMGMDVYQTLQPEIYDIAEMKQLYGNKVSFWGGISVQQFLPFATPEEVKERIVETAQILGKNGGYIMAPTHTVIWDTPVENVLAMLDVFKKQNKYFTYTDE